MIVTGGGRETGVSHARGFAAEGANVVIAGVLDEECRWLARELGVSVLVNNAGITELGTITRADQTSLWHTIDVNLTGAYLGIRAATRSMRKAGASSIVNSARLVANPQRSRSSSSSSHRVTRASRPAPSS